VPVGRPLEALPRPLGSGAGRSGTSHAVPFPGGMTPLEVAVGIPFGADGRAAEPPPLDGAGPPAVLESALLEALARPPCVVAFSGGRDSSLLLAVAVRTARRHGLPEPVAATLRFPGRGDTDETGWQERVAQSLRLAA